MALFSTHHPPHSLCGLSPVGHRIWKQKHFMTTAVPQSPLNVADRPTAFPVPFVAARVCSEKLGESKQAWELLGHVEVALLSEEAGSGGFSMSEDWRAKLASGNCPKRLQ